MITDISEGKYDKLDATFDDGTRLSLNVTNTEHWHAPPAARPTIGLAKSSSSFSGEVDFKDEKQPSIPVKPTSPPVEKKPPPPRRSAPATT